MGQANVNYPESMLTGLDVLAAKRRMSRPELLRSIAQDALSAEAEGRLAFAFEQAPRDLHSLGELATRLAEATMEIERQRRELERREKKLLALYAGGEEANRIAQARLAEQINEHFAQGVTPFRRAVGELKEAHITQLEELRAGIAKQPRLDGIEQELARLNAAIRRPRRSYHLYLGENWKLGPRMIAFLLLVALMVSAMVLTALGRVLPDNWLANRLALSLYGSPEQAICAIDRSAGSGEGCPYLVWLQQESAR